MPCPRSTLFLLPLALLVALPACSRDDDEPEVPEVAVPALQPEQPVERVSGLEIGRTRDGVVLTAYGIAPGLGYSTPVLRARRAGQPGTDGFLDFDMVARPPDPGFALGTGEPTARIVRADLLLPLSLIRGRAGVRVHAATGGQIIVF